MMYIKNFPRANEKYYNSFTPHMTRVWNCLEKSVRNELHIEMFKAKLSPPKVKNLEVDQHSWPV